MAGRGTQKLAGEPIVSVGSNDDEIVISARTFGVRAANIQ
jgi:HSP20 family molecular chaperone IbpA